MEHARRMIWATRGFSWGFRFLADGGLRDPLHTYELAFDGMADELPMWRRFDRGVALRFNDPPGRRDQSGRVIPHDFVLFDALADSVASLDDGLRLVWPLVAQPYERVWRRPTAPKIDDVVIASPPDVV